MEQELLHECTRDLHKSYPQIKRMRKVLIACVAEFKASEGKKE